MLAAHWKWFKCTQYYHCRTITLILYAEEYINCKAVNLNFMFEFPCIMSLYYIKNQQDATLAVSFISNCNITLHVSDAFCVHHQEY